MPFDITGVVSAGLQRILPNTLTGLESDAAAVLAASTPETFLAKTILGGLGALGVVDVAKGYLRHYPIRFGKRSRRMRYRARSHRRWR